MQEQPTSAAANQSTLSPSELRRTLVYRAAASPERIGRELSDLKELDKAAEGKQRLWTAVAVVALIVGVISVVAAIATESAGPVVGIVLGVGGAIVGFVVRAIHGRLNLDDRRYTLVAELLRYLAADVPPDRPLDVSIDFNSYHQRRYRTGRGGRETSYSLPWLALKGTFADGNRFRLAATQVVKRKERHKRKYVKVKESFREKISLTILARAKRYTGLERMSDLMQRTKLPPGIQLRSVNSSANRIIVQALTDCHRRVKGRSSTTGKKADQLTSSHHTMLGLFLACYHCLAQCRCPKGA